ncbi:MAG: hypothetical protein MUC64_14645, partial [Rubritepida sp.]|nr:hypothetical protein [Rubritepida sp.]
MTRLAAFTASFAAPLAAALLALPAFAQAPQPQPPGTIPVAAQGLWANGQCSDPAALLFLTGRYWALLPKEGPQEMWRVERTLAQGGFTLAVADDAEQTRLILRPDGARLETRTPGPKQPDDAIPGDAPATQWARCPSLPAPLAGLHGEGLSFLGALDGLEAACASGEPAGCIAAVFAWADVTRDGVLSAAEMARLVRGATHMAMLATGAELDSLAGGIGAGALGGILGAYALIASYDYDNSGTLSQAELLQDRSPMPGLSGPAAPPAAAVPGPP